MPPHWTRFKHSKSLIKNDVMPARLNSMDVMSEARYRSKVKCEQKHGHAVPKVNGQRRQKYAHAELHP